MNVPDEDDGSGLDNAYWNGKAMFYGNGATSFKPLAGAIDVAGHEMTHGVVQSTANLEYQGESGAINESIADIFGSMMDPADWLIGEDVVKPGAFPGGALRSLQDPHNGGTVFQALVFSPGTRMKLTTALKTMAAFTSIAEFLIMPFISMLRPLRAKRLRKCFTRRSTITSLSHRSLLI